MVGRGRLLVVNMHRRRLRKRNMGAPLHSHFSNDTLHFHEDHLFTRTGQAFFSFASFLSFFFLSLFRFFFFFYWNTTAYFAQFTIRGYASALTAGDCLAETSDDSAAEDDVALPGCGTTNHAMRDAALSLTFSLCFLPSMWLFTAATPMFETSKSTPHTVQRPRSFFPRTGESRLEPVVRKPQRWKLALSHFE